MIIYYSFVFIVASVQIALVIVGEKLMVCSHFKITFSDYVQSQH